jgi:hypothetical protein
MVRFFVKIIPALTPRTYFIKMREVNKAKLYIFIDPLSFYAKTIKI